MMMPKHLPQRLNTDSHPGLTSLSLTDRPGPQSPGASVIPPAFLLCLALLTPAIADANLELQAATAAPETAAIAAEPTADASKGVSASTPPADQPQATDPIKAQPVTTQAESPSSQPESPSRSRLDEMVEATAKRHGVELALVKAVVAAESAYNTQAVSRAGALGLMQVMPATAADYGIGDREKLFDPETNLDTGTRHLKRLLTKYKDDYGRAIMAYNAGEGVVDRTGSMVTYAETLSYTEAVIRHYRRQGGTKPTDEAMAKVRQLRKLKGVQAKQLLAKYLDLNLPSLRGSSRTIRVVAPGLDDNSAQRRPMIVLETKKPADKEKLD